MYFPDNTCQTPRQFGVIPVKSADTMDMFLSHKVKTIQPVDFVNQLKEFIIFHSATESFRSLK